MARAIKFISWNVNGRTGGACEKQLSVLVDLASDVVALQEVTAGSYLAWCDGLLDAGYSILSAVDLAARPYPQDVHPTERKYFNVTAARGRVAQLPGLAFADAERLRRAFPERYLAARVVVDGVGLDVHNAHLPPGSTRGEIKLHAFEAIAERLDVPTPRPLVLCGDFNTPQTETHDSVTTWASAHPELPDWDAAERRVLEHPAVRDIYRERHDRAAAFPASHYTRGTPRRYDHIYASADLNVESCTYRTGWLEDGLSDHAAVEATLMAR